jgi:Elongation factor SelB, winged helix
VRRLIAGHKRRRAANNRSFRIAAWPSSGRDGCLSSCAARPSRRWHESTAAAFSRSSFSAATVEQAGQFVAGLLRDHPDGFTVAQARAALGTSRRYALPLLAELDWLGVTRRHGDVRVPGLRPAPGGRGCR